MLGVRAAVHGPLGPLGHSGSGLAERGKEAFQLLLGGAWRNAEGGTCSKAGTATQLQAALWKPGDVQCEARPRAVLLACEQSRSAKPPSSSSLSGLLSAATVWPRCLLRHQRKRALLQPLQLPGLEPQRPRLPPDCLPLLPALLPAPELALAMRKGTVGFALFTAYLDGLHGVIVSVCVCVCLCVCVSVFLPSISHLPGPLGAVRILNRQLIIPILRTASFECSKMARPFTSTMHRSSDDPVVHGVYSSFCFIRACIVHEAILLVYSCLAVQSTSAL